MLVSRNARSFGGVLALSAIMTGCELGTAGPQEQLGNDTEFFEPVAFSEFEESMGIQALRVEITLSREHDGLVARQVEIQSFDEVLEDEDIESRVVAVSATATGGTLTLALGDLAVGFSSDTRFKIGDEDNVPLDVFVATVQELVNDLHESPTIRAKRSPAGAPQDPTDPAFDASVLELHYAGEDRASIEMNVDLDNLLINDAPPPDGWLQVLGLLIELRISDGITHIDIERDDFEKVEFRGMVSAVDLEHHTFTLEEGRTIRILRDTKIVFERGDHHRLPGLEAVAGAIREGYKVFAAGEGIVEDNDGRVIVATKVVFEVVLPPMEEFEGRVVDVLPDRMALVLHNETIVLIDDETTFHRRHDDETASEPISFATIVAAIRNGNRVFVFGKGMVESEHPLAILARVIVVDIAPPPMEDFEGVVAHVDLNERTVTLENGIVVVINDDTHFVTGDGEWQTLVNLDEVFVEWQAGKRIVARGVGIVQREEPLTILAVQVAFVVKPELVEFEGQVARVDPAASTVTLADETVIRIDEQTKIRFHLTADASYDAPLLEVIRRALEAGWVVHAHGAGVVMEDARTILAVQVTFAFEVPLEIDFESKVAAVNAEAGTFTLVSGLLVIVTGETVIDEAGAYTSLGAVAAALETQTIVARGTAIIRLHTTHDATRVGVTATRVRFDNAS